MNAPIVSIIIPAFNRAHLIGETLDSISLQTYQNWECIIVDDGSDDNSEEIVAEYIKLDNRFKYYKRPKNRIKGANSCRNYGFEKCSGEYIKWFDSDDIMNSKFIEKQVEILKNNTQLDFCASLAELLTDGDDKVIYRANRIPSCDKLTAYLVKNHYFYTASPLWRRIFLLDKELFDETLSDSQETDFHFRMLSFNPKYIYTDDVLFAIRRGHSSITQDVENQIQSNLSRLHFFLKAFNLVERHNVEDKKLLKQYIIYRQIMLFYILSAQKSKSSMLKYSLKIFNNLLNTYFPFSKKIKVIIGYLMFIFTNRGYNFLKIAEVCIREEIEN